jgi:hypothetical protein
MIDSREGKTTTAPHETLGSRSENLTSTNFMSDYKGKVLEPIKEFIKANTTEGYWTAKVNSVDSWINDETVVNRLKILFKDSPEEMAILSLPHTEYKIDDLLIFLYGKEFSVEPNYKKSVIRTIIMGRQEKATIHSTLNAEQI